MRSFTLSLLFVLWLVTSGWAQVANVQCVSGNWSSGSSWTASITPTTGNLLAAVTVFLASDTTNDVTSFGDGTNTYTQANTVSQTELGLLARLTTYYAKNITGGALTVTTTTTNGNTLRGRTCICEASGVNTTAPLDVNAAQRQVTPGTGTDAVTSGAVTTTANGGYVFAATTNTTGAVTFTQGTGYTMGNSNAYSACEHLVQTSAGSIAGTFTSTFGDLTNFYTGIMAFKAASASTRVRHKVIQ